MEYNYKNEMKSGLKMGKLLYVSDGKMGNGKGKNYVYVYELVEEIKDLNND
jgi:hypothetical protein